MVVLSNRTKESEISIAQIKSQIANIRAIKQRLYDISTTEFSGAINSLSAAETMLLMHVRKKEKQK